MKKIFNAVKLSLLTVAFTACTDNYLEINSNPYEPGDLSADDYAIGAALNNLAGTVISPDVNTTQFTECLLGGPMGGYFADSNAGWGNTISNYNPQDNWTHVFMQSDKIIPTLYTNHSFIKLASERTGNPVPLAIADIIRVAAMHRIADTYGPIPYSQIGMDGSINTPYDSQQEVYNKFFEELSAAIAVLTENQNAALMPTADYVYGGNVKNWIKYANSLKLRLAIRIAYADPAKAKQMAEEAVNNEIGVISSNNENAAWNYFVSGTTNPMYTAVNYNKVSDTGGDTHAAADIVCYMNAYNDPRREKYFSKSEWKGIEYVGMRRGIEIPNLTTIGRKYSGVNLETTSPLYWMNAAEVAFLRAEGKAIFGFNMGGEAESFYNEGIRLSFAQWQVEGADSYLDSTDKHEISYTDPSGKDNYNTSLSSLSIKWDEAASKEEKQERIIIQKWIANWQLGNEAWADYRRTGYPHLIPATEAGNKSNGIVDSQEGARRMPYWQDEYVNNTKNINEAVKNYLNGPDNMATKLWWDCKN